MKIWGVGSFENESATAFVDEVTQDGVVALQESFEVVLDPDLDDLEVEEGARAIAAAEILLAGLTGKTDQISDQSLLAWLGGVDQAQLTRMRDMALEALERVVGPASEWPELWEDSPETGAWQAEVQRLRGLLAGATVA